MRLVRLRHYRRNPKRSSLLPLHKKERAVPRKTFFARGSINRANQNLKLELCEIEAKLEKLLDAYLGEIISANDYKTRKENLVIKKVELGEKIGDFETKGLSWLEPAREFVLSLNQTAKLIEAENKEEMTTF